MTRIARFGVRGLLALGLAAALAGGAGAAEPPQTEEAMVTAIRGAIEAGDYDAISELVFWDGAGKMKKRIVRFELNRSLSRPIKSIGMSPFPENGMDGVLATGKLAPNLHVTHAVKVVFDEPLIESTGRQPTAVFLVGMNQGAYRIGLVNRTRTDGD
ncbi:MAG: hypothetical protein ACJARE_002287 [Paracoccaceae bacterium]|jgi:hypothetical protein